MKIVAPFAYNADVVPKGSRKPRRQVLFGMTEHEIAEIPASRLDKGAVVVTPGASGYDKPKQPRISLAGYAGRLWSPIALPAWPDPKPLSTPEQFAASCQTLYPLHARDDNPLSFAFNTRFSPKGFSVAGGNIEGYREDEYAGKIVSTGDRSDMLQRHRDICNDIVLAGDTVYVRRPEPAWEVCGGLSPEIALRVNHYKGPGPARFRLDRLNDTLSWIRLSWEGTVETSGSIHKYDPAYVRRNDVSHVLHSAFESVVDGRLGSLIPYLDADAAATWHLLVRSGIECEQPFDRPFPGNHDEAISRIERIHDALSAARVPGELLDTLETVLRENFRPLLRRVEFERRTAPAAAPAMAEADETAVASLSV